MGSRRGSNGPCRRKRRAQDGKRVERKLPKARDASGVSESSSGELVACVCRICSGQVWAREPVWQGGESRSTECCVWHTFRLNEAMHECIGSEDADVCTTCVGTTGQKVGMESYNVGQYGYNMYSTYVCDGVGWESVGGSSDCSPIAWTVRRTRPARGLLSRRHMQQHVLHVCLYALCLHVMS